MGVAVGTDVLRFLHERFCLVAGAVEGKDRLRDEGFLVYDLADIEAACSTR